MFRRLYIPFHLLILVPLLALAIPLAILAAVTTGIALLALLVRVSIVYLDLGIGLLSSLPQPAAPPPPPPPPPPKRTTSSTATAAVPSSPAPQRLSRRSSRSDSYASLLGVGVPNRDYEGVGGWRLVDDGGTGGTGGGGSGGVDGGDDDDDAAAAAWAGWNARLELPAGGALRRRRSLTSPAAQKASGGVPTATAAGAAAAATTTTTQQDRMRAGVVRGSMRTPGAGREDDGGYFGQNHGLKRRASGIVMTSLGDDGRERHDLSNA
jgi:hypothetical protein